MYTHTHESIFTACEYFITYQLYTPLVKQCHLILSSVMIKLGTIKIG